MGKLQMEGKKQKLAIVITIFSLGVLTTFHISQALGSVGTVRKIKVVVDGLRRCINFDCCFLNNDAGATLDRNKNKCYQGNSE